MQTETLVIKEVKRKVIRADKSSNSHLVMKYLCEYRNKMRVVKYAMNTSKWIGFGMIMKFVSIRYNIIQRFIYIYTYIYILIFTSLILVGMCNHNHIVRQRPLITNTFSDEQYCYGNSIWYGLSGKIIDANYSFHN